MMDQTKESFLAYLSAQNKAPATIVAYGKDIEQLIVSLETHGRATFMDSTKEDLEAFLQELRDKNFTPKTISRKVNSIKTFYKYLQSKQIIKNNPAADLTHPKYEMKEPRILSKMEYRALRDVARADIRTYAIIELFLQTGLRISEVANLTFDNLQEDHLKLGNREIPLNQAAHDAVDQYVQIRPQKEESRHIFITKTGNQLLVRNIRTAVDRALKQSGIDDAKVNDLRVTFIAHQLSAGAPLEYISKLVGHKRISTTERYLNLVKEKPKKGAKLTEV